MCTPNFLNFIWGSLFVLIRPDKADIVLKNCCGDQTKRG